MPLGCVRRRPDVLTQSIPLVETCSTSLVISGLSVDQVVQWRSGGCVATVLFCAHLGSSDVSKRGNVSSFEHEEASQGMRDGSAPGTSFMKRRPNNHVLGSHFPVV
jgi:hypothetical protein